MTERAAYIRREAALSAAINAAISGGFVFAVFGARSIPVWGVPGFVMDFLPQGFMVGLMASMVPGLMARRAAARGTIAIALSSPILLPALATGGLSAAGAALLMAIVFAVSGIETMPFAPALSVKVFFGGALGGLVTALTLRRLLS